MNNFEFLSEEEMYTIEGGGKWETVISLIDPAYNFIKGVGHGFVEAGNKDNWGD
ncbi:lactococcin G-beta/enterocin 1071B family bacteriocin [Anaerosacchariphilus polymeriproducens]|uniref:Bacteriocin n=1 Tax=Anaerosacchariphilus polymeriproducens TaxID=1812858 RepID=A0A371AXM5_9FIRM|nr:lactococcin G-beta/enterocin 1071B family bacteriocin [Anaerosacchariphilus polymeriproducens]RDU24336.1 hypothetical protein DWV06_05005 [Anaerosacchariphilus polymeriproducens]